MGGHIVGWDPAPGSCDPKPNCTPASAFQMSDHETPCNAWTVRGLEILSDLADRYGNHSRAAELREMGSTLRANVLRKMWDARRGRFCDGLCADAKSSNSSVYTDYTTLCVTLPAICTLANFCCSTDRSWC